MVGLVCVTSDNLDKRWLLFEAGALSRHLLHGKVCTILLDVEPVGAPIGAVAANALHPDILRKVFGLQLLLISLHMIFAKHGN